MHRSMHSMHFIDIFEITSKLLILDHAPFLDYLKITSRLLILYPEPYLDSFEISSKLLILNLYRLSTLEIILNLYHFSILEIILNLYHFSRYHFKITNFRTVIQKFFDSRNYFKKSFYSGPVPSTRRTHQRVNFIVLQTENPWSVSRLAYNSNRTLTDRCSIVRAPLVVLSFVDYDSIHRKFNLAVNPGPNISEASISSSYWNTKLRWTEKVLRLDRPSERKDDRNLSRFLVHSRTPCWYPN